MFKNIRRKREIKTLRNLFINMAKDPDFRSEETSKKVKDVIATYTWKLTIRDGEEYKTVYRVRYRVEQALCTVYSNEKSRYVLTLYEDVVKTLKKKEFILPESEEE